MSDYEEALAYLQTDNGDGATLYDHISSIILKVLTERPENSVGIVEKISQLVKEESFVPADVEGKTADQDIATASTTAAKLAYAAAVASHLASGAEDEDVPAPRTEVVACAVSAAPAWRAAGVSFSAEEAFVLNLAMSKLAAADASISTLKLWGKVLGKGADYYVVEGVVDGAELPDGVEPEANKLTYWVCNSPGSALAQLPPVSAGGVLCAQQIKRYFSGDLGAAVSAYPPFPGDESHYLRATIALINADCAVSPAGYFAESEDGADIAASEDFAAGELGSTDGWSTHGPAFSSLGRVTALVETVGEEEVSKPEGFERALLRPLASEDWAVRASFACSSASTTVLRSSKWPGAYATGSGAGAWSNVYCGFGVASTAASFTPAMPQALATEFDSSLLKEQSDVTEKPLEEDPED